MLKTKMDELPAFMFACKHGHIDIVKLLQKRLKPLKVVK